MRRSRMYACNRYSKRTFRRSLMTSRTRCRLKAWKWTDSVSLFFLTDDRRLDHCRNDRNRECRARILREGRALHVAAAGVLDCIRYDNDSARTRPATEKRDAADTRARDRTSRAGRKSRAAVAHRAT